MLKFITVLALVAAASADQQTISYDLPSGQASFTLGAPAVAPNKKGPIFYHPWYPASGASHVGVLRPSVWSGAAPSASHSSGVVSGYPTVIHPGFNNVVFPHAGKYGKKFILVQDNSGNVYLIPAGNIAGSFPLQHWIHK